jgi:hypothetical protein
VRTVDTQHKSRLALTASAMRSFTWSGACLAERCRRPERLPGAGNTPSSSRPSGASRITGTRHCAYRRQHACPVTRRSTPCRFPDTEARPYEESEWITATGRSLPRAGRRRASVWCTRGVRSLQHERPRQVGPHRSGQGRCRWQAARTCSPSGRALAPPRPGWPDRSAPRRERPDGSAART